MSRKETFADRFEILLDNAGFVEGRGRLTEVSQYFDVGKSTAHSWQNGVCPRTATLESIVGQLQRDDRVPEAIQLSALVVWLEKGSDIIPNPFEQSRSAARASGHRFNAAVYLALEEEASNLGFSLLSLDGATLDEVCKQAFILAQSGTATTAMPSAARLRQLLRRLVPTATV